MYSVLSKFYDELLGFDYSFYDELLSNIIKEDSYVLDMACGSGTLVNIISKYTNNIMASDMSQEMLLLAKEKNPYVNFFTHDLKDDFHIKGVDLITCTVDSINYLLDTKDLENFFKNVEENLALNGYFVFDIHSENKLITLENYTWHDEFEDYSYLWDTFIEDDLIIHDITFFIKNNESYERYIETHKQRVYKKDYILSLLKNYEVEVKNLEDRYVFICKKVS